MNANTSISASTVIRSPRARAPSRAARAAAAHCRASREHEAARVVEVARASERALGASERPPPRRECGSADHCSHASSRSPDVWSALGSGVPRLHVAAAFEVDECEPRAAGAYRWATRTCRRRPSSRAYSPIRSTTVPGSGISTSAQRSMKWSMRRRNASSRRPSRGCELLRIEARNRDVAGTTKPVIESVTASMSIVAAAP